MAPGDLGPYRIVAELGSGGMGTVHKAIAGAGAPVAEGTAVAVKVIHPHLLGNEGFVRRFRREAELGRRIRHRNVVATLDVGSAAGPEGEVHWIVLEFVEGRDLRALLGEGGAVPEGLVRHVGVEVARALGAIHAAGVVHRDLKPENVLLAGEQVVKVTDLGVARPVEEAARLSESGAFVGSLQYAAPEQFGAGGPGADARTDLHALGLILYEMATGRHPYAAADVAEALDRLRQGRRARAADVNPRVSPFLDAFLETLLATDPARRFQHADTVARVLSDGETSAWWAQHRRSSPVAARPARHLPVDRAAPFVAREALLSALDERFAAAAAGQGAAVLVEGEAGVGKTRLVDAFVAKVLGRGDDVEVLYGRHGLAGASSGAAAVGTALVDRLGSDGLEDALADLLPESRPMVPALAALLRGEAPPAGSVPLVRDAAATLLLRALRALAQRRPVVLVVDDLHRAPAEGVALFGSLVLGVPGHRLLLVGIAAAGLAPEPFDDLGRRGLLARLAVPRLGAKDLLRLIAEVLGSRPFAEDLLGMIAAASDGNPYFALEILRDLERRGLLARGEDGRRSPTALIRELRVPPSVAELVRARLARLAPEDRNLLDVAACEGAEFDPRLLADALRQPRLPVLQRLARIEREEGLVRSVGARVHFDPPQVRDAVHEAVPEWLRRETHAALAEAVERGAGGGPIAGEDAVRACLHRALAGDGTGAAAHLDAAIAHLAPRHDHRRAAEVERLVLDAPGALAGPRRTAALLRAAERLYHLGAREEEARRLEEALPLADAGDAPRHRSLVRARLARDRALRGRTEEARGLLLEAIAVARAADDVEAEAAASGTLADTALHEGAYEEARRARERQLELARRARNEVEELTALNGLGLIAKETGRYAEARRLFLDQLGLARRQGDPLAEARAEGNLGLVAQAMGSAEEALEHGRRQLELCRAAGHRRAEATATVNVACALFDLGRGREALERFEHHLVLVRELSDAREEAIAQVNLGAVHTALHDVPRAREHLETSLALARSSRSRRVEGYALDALGEVAWVAGDTAEAERRWREALALRREIGYLSGVAATLNSLAGLLAAAGRFDEARAALDEVEALATQLDTPAHRALAAVHRAWLPEGDPARARALLESLGPRVPLHLLADDWARLARVTRDPADRARARALRDRLLAEAPPEARARMHDLTTDEMRETGPADPPSG